MKAWYYITCGVEKREYVESSIMLEFKMCKGLSVELDLLFFMTKIFAKGESCVNLKQELLEHIKKSGLKKSFVAEQIGISPSKMSNYLHGKLILVEDIENKIKDYLERQN